MEIQNKAKIHYHDIGDYLSKEEKLKILKDFGSIQNPEISWQILEPNEHGDWLNQRSNLFESFISLGEKKDKRANTVFIPFYSNGVKTNRDSWVYNYSLIEIDKNVKRSFDFFNAQSELYNKFPTDASKLQVGNFIDSNPCKISWSRAYRHDIENNKRYSFDKLHIQQAQYRPFNKVNLYFSRQAVNDVALIPKLFPLRDTENIVICVPGIGDTRDFSTLISKEIPDLGYLGACQCFPLYWYSERAEKDLFSEGTDDYIRHDGISDYILRLCREQYGHKSDISKEDIFYYVYGILHSSDYRTTFEADLKKMLPRLPLAESLDDFWAFSKAGRALAELHLNYETIEPCKEAIVTYNSGNNVNYKVEKMRFGKVDKKEDKTTIIYNHQITISNIPLEAYEYVVNGKSAIDWIMERYAITTHKESGIQNNPNDWATEHNNEKYILNLLLSIITVSIETMKIVKSLPKLHFE